MLFLAISLRIVKSILFFSGISTSLEIALGYFGLASIGPLLWIYIKYVNEAKVKNLHKVEYLHFLPTAIGSILIIIYGDLVASHFYLYTTYLLIFYSIASWIKFLGNHKSTQTLVNWNIMVLITVSVLAGIFVFQYYTDAILNYAIGALLSSILLFFLVLFAIKNPTFFPKLKSTIKTNPKVVGLIKHHLELEKVYLQPSMTLDQFSKQIDVPAYLISRVVKKEYDKTFPEIINYLRIRDVISELTKEESSYTKIETLAYSVGFNTPSTFYTAFKKITGMSPTELQKVSAKEQRNILLSKTKELAILGKV